MIILLLLLPTLVLSTEPALDWTKCAIDYDCGCLSARWDGGLDEYPGRIPHGKINETPYTEYQAMQVMAERKDNCTKVGVQAKFFTKDAALIQMQLTGDYARNLGEEPKLTLSSWNSTKEIGCKFNNKLGKVELVGDKDHIKNFRITLFEDRSQFVPYNVICAMKIESAPSFLILMEIDELKASFIETIALYEPRTISIWFEIYNGYSYNWYNATYPIKCDPYSFKDRSFSNEYHVKPIMNRDRNVLNCKNYEKTGVSYTMRYDHSKKQGVEMKELKCVGNPNDGFFYSIVRDTDEIDDATGGNKTIENVITSSDAYSFYCTTDITESCENPLPACNPVNDPTCPTFNAGKVGGSPATLECPDNKWLIDGEYYQLKEDPVCKRKKYSKANEAKFYATLPSGNEVALSGARCYTEYDCMTYSKLMLPVCNNEKLCGGVNTTDKNVLKCKEKSRKLRIYSAENDKTLTESWYQCNPATGLWYNGDIVVRKGSVVGCDLDVAHGESETKFKRSSVVDEALPQLLKAIKTLLDTLTGVSGDSPNQSRLMYGTTEETRESDLAGAKQP